MIGFVASWNSERGYGFLADQEGKQYFCHISKVSGGFRELQINTNVSFDVEPVPDKKSPQAINVQVI